MTNTKITLVSGQTPYIFYYMYKHCIYIVIFIYFILIIYKYIHIAIEAASGRELGTRGLGGQVGRLAGLMGWAGGLG